MMCLVGWPGGADEGEDECHSNSDCAGQLNHGPCISEPAKVGGMMYCHYYNEVSLAVSHKCL